MSEKLQTIAVDMPVEAVEKVVAAYYLAKGAAVRASPDSPPGAIASAAMGTLLAAALMTLYRDEPEGADVGVLRGIAFSVVAFGHTLGVPTEPFNAMIADFRGWLDKSFEHALAMREQPQASETAH